MPPNSHGPRPEKSYCVIDQRFVVAQRKRHGSTHLGLEREQGEAKEDTESDEPIQRT